ncbi:MAG: gluconate 2-dehydrogenase subunit 3 family protein [Gemmatimonadota bacterium]|nr:gluconate 2-dehydrogenase subunit 3 family protein [Gemmatimonadota bacterium]
MPDFEINRREFVFGLAGAAGGAWVLSHGSELRVIAAYATSIGPDEPYEFFTPEEARDHDAISAQIIPTDDTPGAREAHVVRFADRFYATVLKEAQPAVRNDFKLLGDAVAEKTPGSRSFAALSDADQIALLTAYEKANPESFSHFRGITRLGMFSHPIHGGNFNQIGWKLIGFEDRYSWTPPFGYYDRV